MLRLRLVLDHVITSVVPVVCQVLLRSSAHMTTLFDPMTSSNSPALDMLEAPLESEKSSDLRGETKATGSAHVSPEPESVTVTVATVNDDPSVGATSCLGTQQNPTQSYADPNAIQFQYRTDNAHVHNTSNFDGGAHIRVVQVHGDENDPAVDRVDVAVSGSNFVQASHVPQQTVIQSHFADSPPNHNSDSDSARFSYYSQTNAEGGNSATVQGDNIDSNTAYIVRTVPVSGLSQPSSPIPSANVIPVTQGAQGQFYVMMPQDVLQSGNQRNIAPRSHPTNQKSEGQRTPRDEKRRATHNEVERRRRDKINNWIEKLAKLVPDCQQDHTKQGQSKGGVLEKTVDYIHDLRAGNARMTEAMKDNETLSLDVEMLRQQYEETAKENAMLRAQLQQHGIEPVTSAETT